MAGRGPRGAVPDAKDAGEWFAGRLPEGWFDGPPTVTVDREEIVDCPPLKRLNSARISRNSTTQNAMFLALPTRGSP